MVRSQRFAAIALVSLMGSFGLAACGSSDSDSSTDTTVAAEPVESTPAETTPADAPAENAPAESTPAEATETTTPAAETTVAAAPSGASEIAAGGDYCDNVKAIQGYEQKLGALDPNNMKASVETFENITADLKNVAASSPDQIKADWEVVAGAMNEMTVALVPLKDFDPANPDPKLVADLQDFGAKMTPLQARMSEAGAKIDEYTERECGFKVGG
jgi:hypothetical protein